MWRTRAATASQLDRPRLGRAVLVGRAAVLKEGAVDPLNVNATVLDRLDCVGAGGGVWIREGTRFDEFRGHNLRPRILKFLVLSSNVATQPGGSGCCANNHLPQGFGCSKGFLPSRQTGVKVAAN